MPQSDAALTDLPDLLLKAYEEVCSVLENLSRSRDSMQAAAVEKLQHTSAKLLEVSSATEVAATGIMDGLDRATALVDELDALDKSGEARPVQVRTLLRDELFDAINCLQFQDITTQQLNYASSILVGLEERLAGLARTLEPTGLAGAQVVPLTVGELTFDPDASVNNAAGRQLLADSIFRQ